jgi:hypothetical protein
MVKITFNKKDFMMKKVLWMLLLVPALGFGQKKTTQVWVDAGFAFFPGSSADIHLGPQANNPFTGGFTAEIKAEKQLNSFLYAGLGGSVMAFSDLRKPYIPVFADLRVIGAGKYKLFSMLDLGYGIYHGDYQNPDLNQTDIISQHGGFYIAYGFGVMYRIFYLQAKYNWLRISKKDDSGKDSKAYGIGGITFGVHLP